MKLQNAFVCYLDILGVKESTGKGPLDALNAQASKLGAFMQEVLRRQSGYRDRYRMGECSRYVKVFSDNVVLTIPIKPKDKEGTQERFRFLLYSVGEVISEALLSGLLIRGGVSVGKAISNDFMVAGDALIKAYEIESKVAKYPRVVLDEAIAKYVDLDGHERLKRDADGHWFYHYITFSPTLALHKEYVLDNLKRVGPHLHRHIDKYRWLVEYHNACCNSGYEALKLPVPSTTLPALDVVDLRQLSMFMRQVEGVPGAIGSPAAS